MLKNIETGVTNYVRFYQVQAKFTKLWQSARKKSLNKSISQKSWRVCIKENSAIKRVIPDLY